MNRESAFSSKRVLFFVLSALVCLCSAVFLGLFNSLNIDEIVVVTGIIVIFYLLLSVGLFGKRTRGCFIYRSTSYAGLFLVTFLSSLLLIGSTFLPEFAKPMLIIPFLFCFAADTGIAAAFAILFDFLVCYFCSQNFYEFASYLILTAVFLFFTEQLKEKKNHLFLSITFFSVALMIPCCFYYLTHYEIGSEVFIWCGAVAIIQSALIVFCAVPMYHSFKNEENSLYSVMLMDEYELVRAIKKYSAFEYRHAIRVAKFARLLAHEIGCNESLCAAAGFYYRIGKMEGEPFIDNGVRLASTHGFPEEVIEILSEYAGQQKPISSRESALVHMTSAVITKLEQLGEELITGNWNQDMVIYQTLNEYSESGLYDQSGLSMNQFIKARGVLLKEDLQRDD